MYILSLTQSVNSHYPAHFFQRKKSSPCHHEHHLDFISHHFLSFFFVFFFFYFGTIFTIFNPLFKCFITKYRIPLFWSYFLFLFFLLLSLLLWFFVLTFYCICKYRFFFFSPLNTFSPLMSPKLHLEFSSLPFLFTSLCFLPNSPFYLFFYSFICNYLFTFWQLSSCVCLTTLLNLQMVIAVAIFYFLFEGTIFYFILGNKMRRLKEKR